MKRLAGILALAALAAVPTLAYCADSPEVRAESAARSWLALIDAGDYAASWSAAAEYFRGRISQSQWVSAVSGVRGPLGAVKSRRLVSATYAHTLPGAPDGEYVVIQFASSFEHKADAAETVTPMKGADGGWHVSGYYIR